MRKDEPATPCTCPQPLPHTGGSEPSLLLPSLRLSSRPLDSPQVPSRQWGVWAAQRAGWDAGVGGLWGLRSKQHPWGAARGWTLQSTDAHAEARGQACWEEKLGGCRVGGSWRQPQGPLQPHGPFVCCPPSLLRPQLPPPQKLFPMQMYSEYRPFQERLFVYI